MSKKTIILLVEDNEKDVLMLQSAFATAGWKPPLITVPDGQEAQDYLEGTGKYADRILFPYPSCVLLDIKMPKMDGLTLLKWIRTQPMHRRLLVFVLTVDQSPARMRLVYDLAANCLLSKPADLPGTVKMAEALSQYLDVIQLPPLPN